MLFYVCEVYVICVYSCMIVCDRCVFMCDFMFVMCMWCMCICVHEVCGYVRVCDCMYEYVCEVCVCVWCVCEVYVCICIYMVRVYVYVWFNAVMITLAFQSPDESFYWYLIFLLPQVLLVFLTKCLRLPVLYVALEFPPQNCLSDRDMGENKPDEAETVVRSTRALQQVSVFSSPSALSIRSAKAKLMWWHGRKVYRVKHGTVSSVHLWLSAGP